MADLLGSVIAAHGGLDRWRTVRAIDLTFNFSGGLLDIKGYPGHHRPSASIDAATPRTVFQRLGDESDDRWIFTPNRVWIERRDGTVVEERSDPRAAFAGHVRETPWDRLHLTYFLGYAVWNYLTAPFLFARTGFIARELEPHVEGVVPLLLDALGIGAVDLLGWSLGGYVGQTVALTWPERVRRLVIAGSGPGGPDGPPPHSRVAEIAAKTAVTREDVQF